MVKYNVECKEYILKILKRSHEKDHSIPLEEARWNPGKKGSFVLELPFPLNHNQISILQSEGMVFIF